MLLLTEACRLLIIPRNGEGVLDIHRGVFYNSAGIV